MYYLVKHSFLLEDESGSLKSEKDQILFDSNSFTEAESRFWKYIEEQGSVGGVVQDRNVDDIRPMKFNEIGEDAGGAWFKVKAHYDQLSEKTGKSKKVSLSYLINEHEATKAIDSFAALTKDWLETLYIDSITETKISDVVIPRKE
jgi:hypothetical protein